MRQRLCVQHKKWGLLQKACSHFSIYGEKNMMVYICLWMVPLCLYTCGTDFEKMV